MKNFGIEVRRLPPLKLPLQTGKGASQGEDVFGGAHDFCGGLVRIARGLAGGPLRLGSSLGGCHLVLVLFARRSRFLAFQYFTIVSQARACHAMSRFNLSSSTDEKYLHPFSEGLPRGGSKPADVRIVISCTLQPRW